MQSFLGDYLGSRKDSVFKLNRALQSFNKQTNKNTELVLISDNCHLTKKEWETNWRDNNRINFYFLEDNSKKMYQKSEEGVFYRGYPRQVGIEISDGEIIVYMDSDDFILPDYLDKLSQYWESNSNLDWIYNNTWFENEKLLNNIPIGYFDYFEPLQNVEKVLIDGLESFWIESTVKQNTILMSPALISHRKYCQVEWKDTFRNKNQSSSEDMLFNKQLREKYKKGGLIKLPGYVRCHLDNYWDF